MTIPHSNLLAGAEAHREWAVALIETLAALESPSGDVEALGRCGAVIARQMAECGARVTMHSTPAGEHLRGEFPPSQTAANDGDASQVLLLGHYDTVWPVGQLARMPVRRQGDRLHGPGVFDMKAGIVIGLLAMRALAEARLAARHRVVMLWTTDEEVGSLTSRGIIEAEARQSRAVLVLEPALPEGGVKTARKGVGDFLVRATGAAAHAGIDPAAGASAIHELAHQVGVLAGLTDLARGLSVNVGTISGGTRSNVIAESAEAHVDVRIPTMADAERVTAAITALSPRDRRVRLDVSGGINRPPFERTARVADLYHRAEAVAAGLGRRLGEGATGGASDGNFTGALGVPTLDGLGAVGHGAHALDEHILLEPLAFRAALLAGLILQVQ
jgi:glutamate carboxypeptidase